MSDSPHPLVTAIILNFRSGLSAVECVRALKAQTMKHSMEILVVDNHSDDDSIGILHARLQGFADVRILESSMNRGFGQGYGLGIAHAHGTYILINNPDKKLKPDALEKMINKMQSDPSIGILAPKLIHDDGTVRHSVRSFPGPWDVLIKRTFLRSLFPHRLKKYLQLDQSIDEERDADWVVGGCLLMRRDFVQQIGGFDPRYFLFFEDIDLCRTCWEQGKRVVYFPSAVAVDRKRRLSEMNAFSMLLRKTGRAHIASACRYFWKWRGMPLPRM
ncbi:hypothetical protein A3D88_03650 [Candidatus Peribacteria bacterium RIFCSPHIGHO2_02_FULL_52_16]|nr:MAG: hypothetical protein A2706_04465 [Candidatus Peribacteria bacterium RIFCSPHIGHO2_01_FULL_51_35]OGJ61778.1 MAG: hypothetical protein A3D88_03650 [Candidatus Peribacteria bacterium RIFCSPHIGHO2_02_FULL_52_16]